MSESVGVSAGFPKKFAVPGGNSGDFYPDGIPQKDSFLYAGANGGRKPPVPPGSRRETSGYAVLPRYKNSTY
jgi:hypothetical protein